MRGLTTRSSYPYIATCKERALIARQLTRSAGFFREDLDMLGSQRTGIRHCLFAGLTDIIVVAEDAADVEMIVTVLPGLVARQT
jgi:hypothetical protein